MQPKIHLNVQKGKSYIYITYILLLLKIFCMLSFDSFSPLSNFQNKILKDTWRCSPVYNSYLYNISFFFFYNDIWGGGSLQIYTRKHTSPLLK